MSDKYKFVEKMVTSELKMRIKTTGNPSFKKALEDELATRSGSVIEGEVVEDSQEAVKSIPEEVDTNVPVEAPMDSEEAVEEAVSTPVKRGRKATK